jgi:hypothetical protein
MRCPACRADVSPNVAACPHCGESFRAAPVDDGGVSTVIPYTNVMALLAYYFGVFSLIPCLGGILGPTAFVLGILGLRYARRNPQAKGTGHAIAGIVLGSLVTLAHVGLVLFAIIGMAASR